LVEHTAENRGVAGSIPALATSASGRLDETPTVPPEHAARPEAASSVAPVPSRYERSLRPCLGTTIALRRRASFRQTLLGAGAGRREPVDEPVDELALQEHLVGAGLPDSPVQGGRLVAGQRDQADVRMIPAQARCRADSVEQRHVQIEEHCVGIELVGELDRLESVERRPDDGQLGLPVDQALKRLEERAVVVGDQDADGRLIRSHVVH
jgi:hypothetical protein